MPHRRVGAKTERALEVRELDDLDRRVRRSLRRAVGGRHHLPRRLEHHANGRFALQRVEIIRPHGLHPLLRQVLPDRLPHLLERRALHAGLVRVVPGVDVEVGDRLHFRRDVLLDERGASDPLRLRGIVHQPVRDQIVERGASRVVERERD